MERRQNPVRVLAPRLALLRLFFRSQAPGRGAAVSCPFGYRSNHRRTDGADDRSHRKLADAPIRVSSCGQIESAADLAPGGGAAKRNPDPRPRGAKNREGADPGRTEGQIAW